MEITYISHSGIKGQRWGVRRYQNEDGSLTSAGKKKYNINSDGSARLKGNVVRNKMIKGGVLSAVTANMATKSILKTVAAKKAGTLTSKKGKKALSSSILKTTLAGVVIGKTAYDAISMFKNRSMNSVGMGGTPENFTGKAKSRQQVLNANKKKK